MSKKDYTKFSNNSNKSTPDQVDDRTNVVESVMEIETGIPNQVEEPVPEVKPVVPIKEIKGVVVNCVRLNVRKDPDPKAEILCTVDANHELRIDEANSTEDFYKVCTAVGIEGYCVKYFINIIP